MISAGAFLLTLLNLFLKIEGPFVNDYLEHMGVRDRDIVSLYIFWFVLVITRFLFVGGSIVSLLRIWRWVKGRIFINWFRVGIFITTYFGLIISFVSLILTVFFGCLDAGRVSVPGVISDDVRVPSIELTSGGAHVSSPVSNISPGYHRVRDTIYYDHLMKEKLLPMSDGVGFVDHQTIPEPINPMPVEVPLTPEAPSTSVGRIDKVELLDAYGDFVWRHAPGEEFMGRSTGVDKPIASVDRLIDSPEDSWGRVVRDPEAFNKIMSDGCRLASDDKVIATYPCIPPRRS